MNLADFLVLLGPASYLDLSWRTKEERYLLRLPTTLLQTPFLGNWNPVDRL
jgi:hypothetical protein